MGCASGQELRTLRGHMGSVWSVAFAADGQVLASASYAGTVKLWDVRTGQELRTLRGHTLPVWSVAFAADGQVLASANGDTMVKLWDTRSTLEHPIPSKNDLRFRLWITSPDLHLHCELAEAADSNNQLFTLAFRVGRYLAAKNYYAARPNATATLSGWLASGMSRMPALLPGLPVAVKPSLREPAFPDGIASTGVLYNDSGIPPARLLISTARAVRDDPTNWRNHAFHGGALYRAGEPAKALPELTEAARLLGAPSPLTHNLLALSYLALGQMDRACAARAQALPSGKMKQAFGKSTAVK